MDSAEALMTDYERRRLENIRRNKETLSSLTQQQLNALNSLNDHRRRSPPPKKPKPAVSATDRRRSLRTQGIPPPSPPRSTTKRRRRGPLPFRDAFIPNEPDDSDFPLLTTIFSSTAAPVDTELKRTDFDPKKELILRPENIVSVGNKPIQSLQFLPLGGDRKVIAIGSSTGNLGFWDVDGEIYVYRPHSGLVSGISVHPFSPRKIFTSSRDRSIQLMDIEKESFNVLISGVYPFTSIRQSPHDSNSLYVGQVPGKVKFWDEREGKGSISWKLHDHIINTIDFSPENQHWMATSSGDGLSCIWDLRNMKKKTRESIKSISLDQNNTPAHSAYFSPSGKHLAITSSYKGIVGILTGANFDDLAIVSHNDWALTGGTFRATWGWDDSYLFISNKKSAIGVLSTSDETVTALKSPYITSFTTRFALSHSMMGYLAGSAPSGKVFLWTKR